MMMCCEMTVRRLRIFGVGVEEDEGTDCEDVDTDNDE